MESFSQGKGKKLSDKGSGEIIKVGAAYYFLGLLIRSQLLKISAMYGC
jgi:hypothetical protein